MRGYGRLLVAAAVVLALAGCKTKPDSSVELDTRELGWIEKGTHGTVTPFHEALRESYLAFGSDHLVRKSRLVIQGRAVAPDHPDSRRLPPGAFVPVEEGYGRMMRTLHLGAANIVPNDAARMQVAFDCWIEGLDGQDEYSSFAACGDTFWSALAAVESACAAALEKKCGPAPEPMVAEAPPEPAPPPPAPAEPRTFIVFFDWDSDALTGEARAIIASAVDYANAGGASRVQVTGHADRSGSDSYNMGLSRRRAEAVKAEFIRLGMADNEVGATWRGEQDPLVATPDGVREPQNRRVEIVIP